ncbi:elongation factor P maturation arginine rhamnosyltransferase EarP [Castellaniella sp.]|uniref:elongation factor P maturation arginine rhamnosyltransferase EarP n=1 Tax=Castellaniella sp. TaxID=1955812 RepID=UPI003560E756
MTAPGATARLAFDVFCQVIDNYGDAGVCWRLARQLASRGYAVRLWIDRLSTLAQLVPALDVRLSGQRVDSVHVGSWAEACQAMPPRHGVVLEAFGCTLPVPYQARIVTQDSLWVNLEYLSAETWTARCHGLPSPQASGAIKYFYFPGFTPASGGLLRESGLLARRDRAHRQDRRQRLHALTGLDTSELTPQTRCVLLFAYPQAPMASLQAALSQQAEPVWLLVPGGTPQGLHDEGSLRVHAIPFVPQARFDEVLWCCDLNFVRGEDSLVRAIWAARPLVWQLYPQTDQAHLAKLRAWLDILPLTPEATQLQNAWNGRHPGELVEAVRQALRPAAWQAWQLQAQRHCKALAAQDDLVTRLLAFCVQHRETR